MSTKKEELREQNITRAKAALERVRSTRRTKRILGVDGICELVKDVDGDWLENWTDEESATETNIRRKKPVTV